MTHALNRTTELIPTTTARFTISTFIRVLDAVEVISVRKRDVYEYFVSMS